ncbi:hypothetical protein COBT_000113 [Conglomerata obtusa]
MLKDGSLRLSKSSKNFYFKIKLPKGKCPIIKHINTPPDLYNYLVHVLEGKHWRMVGNCKHFQIRNGMYCITNLMNSKEACRKDYPLVVSPCCSTDSNQYFTVSNKNKNTQNNNKSITTRRVKVGFPYDNILNNEEECECEGNMVKGGENDRNSIIKRITNRVDKFEHDDCFECYNEIEQDSQNVCNENGIMNCINDCQSTCNDKIKKDSDSESLFVDEIKPPSFDDDNGLIPDLNDINGDGNRKPPTGDDDVKHPPSDDIIKPPTGDDGVIPPTGDGKHTPPTGDDNIKPPTGDDDTKPPTGDDDIKPPTDDDDLKPPTGDGSHTPPPGDGSHTHPPGDGSHTPPPGDGSHTPPPGDGSHTPPPGDGSHTPPPGDGSHTPPPGDGSQTPPTVD